MQLEYIAKPNNCLHFEDINQKLSIESCMEEGQRQQWKLDNKSKLVSRSERQYCADPDSLTFSHCDESSSWISLPFALKTDPNSYLGVGDDSNVIKVGRSDSYMRAMWRRFGDPTRTICGGKISVDNTKNQSELFKEFLKYIPP